MSHTSTGNQRHKPVSTLMRQWDGPLTADLLRSPAAYGLGQVPHGLTPDATTSMVCGFCSTGCSLNIHLKDGEAVNLTPTVNYPVNLGMACPKGWEALNVLKAPDRGTTPLLREGSRRTAASWQTATETMCRRFKEIQAQHGPESVAFISTGQMPTEEMALLGALAKFGMGMVHGDGNTRQCMATAAVAYKQSLGFDAPPYTYQDFEESDVIVLAGSNLCIAHPIMWQRVCRNPHNPQIIVVDPRATETAMAATQHLALKPKSDLALFYGLAHLLIRENWIDHQYIEKHTSGFDEFAAHVASFTPQRVAAASGIPEESLLQTARAIHQGKRVSFWWTMGVNQSYEGVRTAQSLINLALITGNIGRPGTGANSITGQCNAMGSRLFSNTTNLFGGRDFTNASDRNEVASILDIDPACIPSVNSNSYDEILEDVLRGRIKALWIISTNTSHSWINQNTCRDVLGRLDYLVVQDMYHSTETAAQADLYLPAAGWGEKQGTFINSERRVGVLKQVAKAPGEALSDYRIFRLIAHQWGCGGMFQKWATPAAAFEQLKALSKGRPCDISGIENYQMLDDRGGVQWPYPAAGADDAQQRRLFEDGRFYHADGRARMLFEDPRPMPEPPNPRFPFLLMTGRGTAAQWHTQTRTGKSDVLNSLCPPGVYVEINPGDARQAKITSGQRVVVASQRGQIKATAFVTATIQPGQAFIPMHYEEANQLTLAHFDPYSKQPSYKNCAVSIRPAASHD